MDPTAHLHIRVPAWCLALSLSLSACAAAPPAGVANDVESLIGPARCLSDDDCRTSPVGQQACGGPAGFVAWSVRETDAAALQAALDARQSRDRAPLAGSGRVSTCQVKVDPGAQCTGAQPALAVPGRCLLRPAGSLPSR